jgi:predicted O-methyltransferase YrrM
MKYSLKNKQVKTTLETLHAKAKNDWKVMLLYAPQIIWGMLRGRSMMKAFTPNMAKHAYMPVNEAGGKLLYNMVRSTGAKHIIEFGSSFGIGTIYLAAAAKDNGGHVFTTEIEAYKCLETKKNLKAAGLEKYVTLLEGDALKTLQDIAPNIDLVFLDGWKDLYNDVLDLLLPKLRNGAMVIGDNITLAEAKDYFARVSAENSGFVTSVVNKDTSISCYVGRDLVRNAIKINEDSSLRT